MITFNQLGRYGRIGNQMFEIAGTIGIAKKHGYDFAFPYWKNYDEQERFSGTEDIDIQKWFANPLPLIEKSIPREARIPWGYHPSVVDNIPDNVSLQGHMQSEKYFKHCEETIKYYFKFKHETKEKRNTVAVHFRGGDYGGGYHPTCSKEYYKNAYDLFDEGFTFLLFTDDPERAAAVIPFEYELVNEPHPMRALELMTRCDAHIIANSTFSWWGAWLANSRQVIAPAVWFGPEASKLETKDIYPDNWIVI